MQLKPASTLEISSTLINLTLYKLEKIVNGEGLDEFIDTLTEQDQVSKLAQLGGGNN